MYKIMLSWKACIVMVVMSGLLGFIINLIAATAAGSAWEGLCSVEQTNETVSFLCEGEEGSLLSETDELMWYRLGQPKTAECAITHGTFASVDCTFTESLEE